MIISKVIRDHRRHITRADYGDRKPMLGSENVVLPRVKSLQARALRRLFPAGSMLSHREFDSASHSYRLGSFIDELREKGWTIVDHDEVASTGDDVPRKAKFTRYELFAEFTPELLERIGAFCKAVDDFEARAKEKRRAAFDNSRQSLEAGAGGAAPEQRESAE
ncbi:hypothetical protein [Methylococcus sp. EFPC2]|uniref:hypothetical protein n=1 Tax=Methylococcus sp. EFPC2 TaxID=2812648 RepID=UPI0019679E3B|nr:hypothetical protein [Methylococcus sp. EFPC2]QSA97729.1 hypothetical protein JWZ97_02535 [Methylococcus sp. EFPC2]